jgi:hypothetical protein
MSTTPVPRPAAAAAAKGCFLLLSEPGRSFPDGFHSCQKQDIEIFHDREDFLVLPR